MWTHLVWGTCIGLECLLLVRVAMTRLSKRFPTFYSYIAFVLLADLVAIPIFKTSASAYLLFYWSTTFLEAILGYVLIVEIYHISLKDYPGVVRLVRILLLMAFFAVVVKCCFGLLMNTNAGLPYAIGDLERTLRQLQAALIACLLVIFAYYKIPMDKNLRGIILGYSLFVAVDVISVTIITHPATGFAALMRSIEPVAYAVSLSIWVATLWRSSPQIAFQCETGIEHDYERLVRATHILLLRARTHLNRAVRP